MHLVSQGAAAGAVLSCGCRHRPEDNRAVRQDGTHDRLPHVVKVRLQSRLLANGTAI